MNCPYCNHPETKVNDSREGKDGSNIKRRRECLNCTKRFSTIEKVLKLDLEVQKSNGEIEEFKIGKIHKGIMKSCEKRPVTLEQIDEVVEKTLSDLKKFQEPIIPTATVGKIVLKNLKNLDEIAYLRFALVHNKYGSINDFVSELKNLKSSGIEYKKKQK